MHANLSDLDANEKRSAWNGIIEDFNGSGENQTHYCKSRGINKEQFGYYLRQWRKANSNGLTKVTFMPMEVTIPQGKWILNIGNGVNLELPANMPMEQLSAFILNLRKMLC